MGVPIEGEANKVFWAVASLHFEYRGIKPSENTLGNRLLYVRAYRG